MYIAVVISFKITSNHNNADSLTTKMEVVISFKITSNHNINVLMVSISIVVISFKITSNHNTREQWTVTNLLLYLSKLHQTTTDMQ